jgi:hypothetical protein
MFCKSGCYSFGFIYFFNIPESQVLLLNMNIFLASMLTGQRKCWRTWNIGVPSRAEITDSTMLQRAKCVVLNKGLYIEKAVKVLDRILSRMQNFKKKEPILPKLEYAWNLS